ncbi:MAG: hypothetical protein KDC61_04240 [Saprospiraceae bacterium]|nr:hypothetical protein [Saprospiraceae bacterium]MCB0573759.1 hypothetical protein [Saprospiraceae bacterium]MCB9308317.1 hypothetical protein [Lewinellaceae bacterium]MCB9356614.1 hypothetical protein [Lewinellaceae bacterium]
MKNLFLACLAACTLALFQSCKQEESLKPTTSGSSNGTVSQYCPAIDDYVAAHYPGCTIEQVTIKAVATAATPAVDVHAVELDGNCPCLLFDIDCNFIGEFASGQCPD